MRENYKLRISWFFIKLLGINVSVANDKNKESCGFKCYKLCNFLVIFSSVFCIFIIGAEHFNGRLNYSNVSDCTMAIATVLMYFSFFRASSNLSRVRKAINKIPLTRRETSLFIVILLFVMFSILSLYLIRIISAFFSEEYPIFVTKFEFKSLRRIIFVACIALRNFLQVVVPSVLNSLFCTVCYHWIEVILSVKNDLQTVGIKYFSDLNKMDASLNLLGKCRFLWRGTKLIKDTFSSFLFFLIVMQVVVMFLTSAILTEPKAENNSELKESKFLICILTVYVFFSHVLYI